MSKQISEWALVERIYYRRRILWFSICPVFLAAFIVLGILRIHPVNLWVVLVGIVGIMYGISLIYLMRDFRATRRLRRVKRKYAGLLQTSH